MPNSPSGRRSSGSVTAATATLTWGSSRDRRNLLGKIRVHRRLGDVQAASDRLVVGTDPLAPVVLGGGAAGTHESDSQFSAAVTAVSSQFGDPSRRGGALF